MSQLSSQLVQQWLMIVKGTAGQIQQQVQAQNQTQVSTQNEAQPVQSVVPKGESNVKHVASDKAEKNDNNEPNEITKNEDDTDTISTGTFYKTSGKDGKLLIRKSSQDSKGENEDVSDDSGKSEDKGKLKSKTKSSKTSSSTKTKIKEKDEKKSAKEVDREKEREKDKDKDKRRSSHSSSSKSSSSSRHKSSSSNRSKEDRDKDKHRDKGKDKERDKSKDSEKDKHRINGALKSSSSNKSSKDKKDNRDKEKEKAKSDEKEKEKQIEKDNNTIEKLKPPSIDKLGRIPKKTPLVEEKPKENTFDSKKKGFSVGIRKDKENDERPKTVKVFNSKMRSTGLEEEVKPALPRSVTANKKPTPSVQLPTIPQKRPSPPKDIRESVVVPEKKLKLDKIDIPERPGAIKLIPPKPKRELSELLLFIFILFLQIPSIRRRKFPAATLHHLQGPVSLPFCQLSSHGGKRQSCVVSFIFLRFYN